MLPPAKAGSGTAAKPPRLLFLVDKCVSPSSFPMTYETTHSETRNHISIYKQCFSRAFWLRPTDCLTDFQGVNRNADALLPGA